MPHEILGIPKEAFYDTVILYGFGHGIWAIIKHLTRKLETETGRIIRHHVKSGHDARLKNCVMCDYVTRKTAVVQPEFPPTQLEGR